MPCAMFEMARGWTRSRMVFPPSSRTRGGRHVLLFHQPHVGEQGQLHQEPGRLSVWHHLQDGERLLHAERQGPGALPETGIVMLSS